MFFSPLLPNPLRFNDDACRYSSFLGKKKVTTGDKTQLTGYSITADDCFVVWRPSMCLYETSEHRLEWLAVVVVMVISVSVERVAKSSPPSPLSHNDEFQNLVTWTRDFWLLIKQARVESLTVRRGWQCWVTGGERKTVEAHWHDSEWCLSVCV